MNKKKKRYRSISCSHLRGKKFGLRIERLIFPGTLPFTWEKAFRFIGCKNLDRNTPTHVGKRIKSHITSMQRKEHSHLRGKRITEPIRCHERQGTLPLAWEKESVFMRLSKVFAAICMKNFYKITAIPSCCHVFFIIPQSI